MLKKRNLTDPSFSFFFRVKRLIWNVFYTFFIRFSPTPLFRYRSFLYKLWGAKISSNARIYPSAKIWWPPNFAIGERSTVGPNVRIYNQGSIQIGESVIISQGAYLCASTHDYNDSLHPLVLAPIRVENHVWVCAEAFVGPNVRITEACVIGARAVLTKDTDRNGVYAGNPAKFIKPRKLNRYGQ